ncbi:metallophosphoesterase [Fructobacillus sp. M158]|uniref:metallophosphoesterase n=1 Tax=Fructobacillus parabroussonetiae TaxID=2713174 RepID=UPI00200A5621|nr:metallophosphoesterase [Fructobacillus parabroussonetiae]MCK8617407.1 metallophosphoesterase [Fructobacillus parabroussonetiae]
MRLAVISDLHLDINQINEEDALNEMAQFLLNQQIGVFVLAGDTYNHLKDTAAFAENLSARLSPVTKVYYLAGNHEMGDKTPDQVLESPLDAHYLHRKSLDIGDYRLIGNNGWYDYSFDDGRHDEAVIHRFKQSFWYDRRIEEVLSDKSRAARSAKQIQEAVLTAKAAGQKPIMITHFSNDQQLIDQLPFSRPELTVLKAFLGSKKLGQQLIDLQVPILVSGHVHWQQEPHRVQQTTFYNVSLGYRTRRIHEWRQDDFFQEWRERLLILDL